MSHRRRARAVLSGGGGVVDFGIPMQSLGAELLTNGDFSAWTANNPNSWTVVGESGSDPEVSEVGSGQLHGETGNGLANLFSSASNNDPQLRQSSVFTATDYFEQGIEVNTRASGTLIVGGVGGLSVGYTSTGIKTTILRPGVTTFGILSSSAPTDVTVDNATVKLITLNPQQTAPSANMRIEFLYTLSASPNAGEQVWVMPRISNFASGNYWLALKEYTGTQWNVTLYSVATHTRTSRISATNVGATNGIAINMNGDSISLYTTADGGMNWTQRGTTISNATYNTATGVNVLYSSTVTPGNLAYETAA